jgi:hypothetical protein
VRLHALTIAKQIENDREGCVAPAQRSHERTSCRKMMMFLTPHLCAALFLVLTGSFPRLSCATTCVRGQKTRQERWS